MYLRICAICVAVIALLFSVSVSAERLADHVVLVSVDGFRPDFYQKPEWPAPTIQQMARDGAQADAVRGVFPSVTYPSHTTIVTGVMPGLHGVLFNHPFEPEGQTGRWYWEYDAIQVPTLWTAVRDAGGKTGAVSWPVTVGAPIDWVLPEVWSLSNEGNRLAPMEAGTKPEGLWEEFEREATGRLAADTYGASYIGRDDKTGQMAAYLLEKYRPTFLAMHVISADHFQHEDGREADSSRRAVAACDNAIRMVTEAAEKAGILDRTAFIVTGDHGFVDLHTVIAPNVWLAEAGLHGVEDNRGDWKATFHTSGGGAFLRLKDPNDEETYNAVVEIINALPPRVLKLFRAVQRDELNAAGADPHAPFALAAGLGVTFTARADGEAIAATSGGTHGHFPSDFPEIHTGFVAWGAGIARGRTVHAMGLEDIAPLIAHMLDVDLPSAVHGSAPLGILDDDN